VIILTSRLKQFRLDLPALHLHQVGQKTFTSKLLSMPSTQRTRFRGRGHPERTGSCHLWPSRRTAAVRCSPACSMLGDSGRQCRSQRGANSAKSHGFQGLIGGSCAFSVPCFHGGIRLNCDDDAPGRGPMRFKCEVTSRHVQPCQDCCLMGAVGSQNRFAFKLLNGGLKAFGQPAQSSQRRYGSASGPHDGGIR
jgi:hypothetical protein